MSEPVDHLGWAIFVVVISYPLWGFFLFGWLVSLQYRDKDRQ